VSLVRTPHAPSLSIVSPSQNHVNRLIDGLNIGLSGHPATHHLRLVLPACARKLALQRRVGHHGYRRRHVQGVVVGNRLNVAKMVTEVSVGPFGQAVRLQADQRTICSDNIAFHTSRISLELCQLIWSENNSNRSTISEFAVHIPRSLGAGGAFFGPVISSVDTNGTHQQVRCTRAEDLGMVTMDLSGICGWSPTRARTRLVWQQRRREQIPRGNTDNTEEKDPKGRPPERT